MTPSLSGDIATGQTVQLTVSMSAGLTVDTTNGSPTLSLSDNAAATYDSAASDPSTGALVFDYTVAAGDYGPGLSVAGFNANGASVTDANGVSPDFSGLAQSTLGLDVNAATVASVTASPSGEADSGQQVLLTLTMSEPVTVNTTGGSPTLDLSDGAIATYDSAASNPAAGALVFAYTVGATDEDSNLQIARVKLNGAAIDDANGNAADLTAATTLLTNLQIGPTIPDLTVAEYVADPAAAEAAPKGFEITDSAANVAIILDALNADPNLNSITLTDPGTPTLHLTAAQATGDTSALKTIANKIFEVLAPTLAPTYYVSNTGGALQTVTGSHVTVILRDGQASVVGGNDIVDLDGSPGDLASLSNTGANWDTVNGSKGTTDLTSAKASVIGGGDTVDFAGGSGNAASLYNTGANWDKVTGSNGWVGLTSAKASVIGGSDTIVFAGGSGNAASLYNTGGNWDTVNGSNGWVGLTSAKASVKGGADTIVFAGGSGNAASLYNTGSNWDTVNGLQWMGRSDQRQGLGQGRRRHDRFRRRLRQCGEPLQHRRQLGHGQRLQWMDWPDQGAGLGDRRRRHRQSVRRPQQLREPLQHRRRFGHGKRLQRNGRSQQRAG